MVIDYLGIYGVCLKENKVLCIKKARGPYKNRFDLPGGSQKTSEGFTETLVREFLEETGYKVNSYNNCRVYDVFVEEEGAAPKDLKLNKVHMRTHRRSGLLISKIAFFEITILSHSHHMMVYYDVEIETYQSKEIQTFLGNEKNDSAGIYWMDISELNITNAPPLLLKLKQEILNDSNILEKIEYKSWRIL